MPMTNNAMASAHAAVAKAVATVVRLNIVIIPSQKVLISACDYRRCADDAPTRGIKRVRPKNEGLPKVVDACRRQVRYQFTPRLGNSGKGYPSFLTMKRPSFRSAPSRPASVDRPLPNPDNIFRYITPAVLAAARINACDAIPARRASA